MAIIGKNGESGSGPVYAALIGDVVGSRELPDRAGFQERLQEAAKAVGKTLRPQTAAELQLTAGDEVQGLFTRPEATVRAVQELSDRIWPVRMTFGLGRGTLSTGPLPSRRADRRVALLDGACFHHARQALELARSRQVWMAVSGFGPFDVPLGALLELVGTLRGDWTEKQGQYAAAARGRTQKEVAGIFNVSPSVVSESLKAAHLETVLRGEEGAAALLGLFGDKAEWLADSVKEAKG